MATIMPINITEIGQILATLIVGFGLIKVHMDLGNRLDATNARIDARIDALYQELISLRKGN